MNQDFARIVEEERLQTRMILAGVATTAVLLYLAVTEPTGAYEQLLTRVAMAVGLGLAVYPVLGKPVLGLFAIAAAAIAPPIEIGPQSGMAFAYLAAPVIFTAWLLIRLSALGGARFMPSPVYRPLVLLLVTVTVALLIGQYHWFGSSGAPMTAKLGGLGVFFCSAAVFAVAAHEFRDTRWLQATMWALLFGGALIVLSAILSELGIQTISLARKEQGLGSGFWTWLAALAFAQGLANRELSKAGRIFCFALVAGEMALTLGIWRDWASGWAPACVAMCVILFAYRPRIGLLLAAIGAAVVIANSAAALDLTWTNDQAYSTHTRAAAASTLYNIAKESPIIGFGPANYYHYTPMFPILGWYVHFSSHNNYFDLVLQSGLIGLACVAWLWFELGLVSWKATRTAREGFERAYVYGAMGGLAGTAAGGALGDWFLPFIYNVGLNGFATSILAWLFLGGLVAVASLGARVRTGGINA